MRNGVNNNWGIAGCATMSREYCKALISRGITPQVFSRNLVSENVVDFRAAFPELEVKQYFLRLLVLSPLAVFFLQPLLGRKLSDLFA